MLNIMSSIQERAQDRDYLVNPFKWIDISLAHNDVDILYWIIFEGELASYSEQKSPDFMRLLEKYRILGEFSLGRPYVSSEFHFSLVIMTRQAGDEKYLSSTFNGIPYETKTMVGCAHDLVISEKYKSEYLTYLEKIEKWINNGTIPEDDSHWQYEFNIVPYTKDFKHPRYYSKRAKQVRELLNKETVIQLGEIAEILEPEDIDQRGTVLIIDEKKPYQYDSAEYIYGNITTVKAEKGDIVYPRLATDAKPYFISDKLNTEVYISADCYVIRTRKIIPEYLWLYLTSDVAIYVLDTLNAGKLIKVTNVKELYEFPVISPNLENQRYIAACNKMNTSERDYSIEGKQLFNPNLQTTSVSDLFNLELVQNMRIYEDDKLRDFINRDMAELQTCYKNEAYKATLILAGSLLEAILIDWLSEINNINYFENDYMIPDSRHQGRLKRADLVDYIDAIKALKKPAWMDEAQKSHAIRQKRNFVHAKLCLNSLDVNQSVCRQVIEYLNDVIRTRGLR